MSAENSTSNNNCNMDTLQNLRILVIDDDTIIHKIISKAIADCPIEIIFAENGEQGLDKAVIHKPDLIILDVEMPGINGYEVCQSIRQDPVIADTPITFLTSYSTLEQRLQGYSAGANDYLIKPFEADHLKAKIQILAQYSKDKKALQSQIQLAQDTAFSAMTTSSELGIAMHYVEKSYRFRTYEELAQGLFQAMQRLNLECCLMLITDTVPLWFSSDNNISPLEKELMEMSDRSERFTDSDSMTIVHFSQLSLLVRNMPIDDAERYGRIKDLIPILLSTVNSQTNSIKTEQALLDQSHELMNSFAQIRTHFYYLAQSLIEQQNSSQDLLSTMIKELDTDLIKMGLEDDQEAYVLKRVDDSVEAAMENIDASYILYETFSAVVTSLKEVINKQQHLIDSFEQQTIDDDTDNEADDETGIDLF